MKSRRRLLSILLTVAMIVMMMPGVVFAGNGNGGVIDANTTANEIIKYFGGSENVSVSGKTITLLQSVTVDSSIQFTEGEWMLDIGEYTLKGKDVILYWTPITPLTVSGATLRIAGKGTFCGGDYTLGNPKSAGIKLISGSIEAEVINAFGGNETGNGDNGGAGIEISDGSIKAGTINAKGGKGGDGRKSAWDDSIINAGKGGPGINISENGKIEAEIINATGGEGGNFDNGTGGEGGDGISGYNGTKVSASILNVTPGTGGKPNGNSGKPIRGDGVATYYTVNFENCDEPINTQIVAEGGFVINPGNLSKKDHEFHGWYSDEDFNTLWNFDTSKVTENTTLYAKWVSTIPGVEKVTVQEVEGIINGTDISVILPYETDLSTITDDDIKITPAAGATVEGKTLTDNGDTKICTFTVMTGTTPANAADYTITISVADNPATVIKSYTWTVSQSVANTEAAVKAWIEEKLKSPDLVGVKCAVTDVSITPAVADTSANPQGTNGSFSFTVKLTMESGAIQEPEVTISNGIITATPYTSSGGGGGYIPPAPQKPIISQGEGYTTELDKTGKNLTITPAEDYELVNVVVNGIDKGAVTTLSGLKTGDKVEITVISKVEKIKEILASVEKKDFKARSQLIKMKSGKKAVMITIVNNSGVKFDGVEVYRSTKKNSGYGKKPIFTTKTGKYYNTAIKKGSRYYYKARGYMEYKGEKYYTDYSLKAWRMVK